MKEIWKDIKGYEKYYQVSSFGKIKSLDRYVIDKKGNLRFKKGKVLALNKDNDGYLHIRLHKNGESHIYTVHKIVATHFIEQPDDFDVVKYEINHKDNNRENNNYDNLEWVTHADNIRHSVKQGTAYCINGLGKHSVRKIKMYDKNMFFVKEFDSVTDCAKYLIDNKISKAKSVNQLTCNISRFVDKEKLYIEHYFKSA